MISGRVIFEATAAEQATSTMRRVGMPGPLAFLAGRISCGLCRRSIVRSSHRMPSGEAL